MWFQDKNRFKFKENTGGWLQTMSAQKKYCVNCFIVVDWDSPYCPRCTYPQPIGQNPNYLRPPHRLHNQYIIGRVLGHGSFGITYLAYDRGLGTKVAIKEYFPLEFASRNPTDMSVIPLSGSKEDLFFSGKKKFIAEARLLSSLRSPHIIRIRHFFEEGNTAYFVMEYLDGQTLKDFIEGLGGKISFEEFRPILNSILNALEEVHSHNSFHRDIKPENIYMTVQKHPILLDFGSARHQQANSAGTTIALLTPGFAPIEQYSTHGIQGPWTDIYGVAATVYSALTGRIPPYPQDRLTEDEELRPAAEFGATIRPEDDKWLAKGLELRWNDRPSSVTEWRRLMPAPPQPEHSQKGADLSNADENFIRFAIMPKLANRFLTPETESEIYESASFLNISKSHTKKLIDQALKSTGSVRRNPMPSKVSVQQQKIQTTDLNVSSKANTNLTFSEIFQPGPLVDSSIPLPENLSNSTHMNFVLITPFTQGSGFRIPRPFAMGQAENRYSVTLTRQYYLQSTPVTQEQWKMVMGSNPSHFKQADHLPVERVTWDECQEFIRRMNTLNEGTYRLPTEAEWEFGCQANHSGPYFFGPEPKSLQKYAWYQDNAQNKTHPVGQLKPNPFGLLDIYGNIWEWCSDYYASFPQGHATDPQGPSTGQRHVLRGGSWKVGSSQCRTDTRWHQPPETRSDQIGLRLILMPGKPE